MQQYRLTKKKRKENEGYKSSSIAEFSGETRFIFDPPLPPPFVFPFSFNFHPAFCELARVLLAIVKAATWNIFSNRTCFSSLVSGGLERLNTVRQNRQRESYLNSLRYCNVEERRKEKNTKIWKKFIIFFSNTIWNIDK